MAEPPARRFGGVTARIGVLAVTETISWGVLYYSFSALLVPMAADGVGTRGQLSGVFALAIVVRALAQPLAGAWVDRFGVRGLMTAGSLGGVGLTLAWAAVHDVTHLAVVFAGIGVVSSMVLYEPAFAAAARWLDGRARTKAILTITIVAGFASTIFLPLTAALTEALDWRSALRVLAVILAVGTVVPHAVMLREPRRGRPANDRGRDPSGADRGDPPVPGGGDPPSPRGSRSVPEPGTVSGATSHDPEGVTARSAVRDPVFWWLVLTFVCSRGPIVGAMTHLPALLVDRGESVTVAASITGSIGVLSVIGRVALTATNRWVSMHHLLLGIFLAQAAGFVLLALTPNRVAVAVFVLTFGIGFGATTIAKPVMVAERYGRRAYGAIAGIVATLVTLAEAASPTLIGLARDVSGSYDTSLTVLAGVMVLGAVAAHRYRPVSPTPG